MSDYGALSTNGVSAGMKKDAFADAVQRARQVMSARPQMETAGEPSSSLPGPAHFNVRCGSFQETVASYLLCRGD